MHRFKPDVQGRNIHICNQCSALGPLCLGGPNTRIVYFVFKIWEVKMYLSNGKCIFVGKDPKEKVQYHFCKVL